MNDVNLAGFPLALVDPRGVPLSRESPLPVRGGVVRQSLTQLNTTFELGTGSSVTKNQGLPYNNDGSNLGLLVVPAATGFVLLWVPFFGRCFGVRFLSTAQPFTVSVDGGDAVMVDNPEKYLGLEGETNANPHAVEQMTHTDLADDTQHYAKIEFPPNATSSVLLGTLLDSRFYRAVGRAHGMSASIAVPTSAALLAPYSSLEGSSVLFNYISKVVYGNPSGGDITVTWYDGATAIFPFLLKAGGTDGGREFTFPIPITSQQIRHAASGAGAYCVAYGGYYG